MLLSFFFHQTFSLSSFPFCIVQTFECLFHFFLFGCRSEIFFFVEFKFPKSKNPKYFVRNKHIQTIAIKSNQNLISNPMFSVPKNISFFFRPSWATANITADVMYFHGFVVICGYVNRTSINSQYWYRVFLMFFFIFFIRTLSFFRFSFTKMLRAIQCDSVPILCIG